MHGRALEAPPLYYLPPVASGEAVADTVTVLLSAGPRALWSIMNWEE